MLAAIVLAAVCLAAVQGQPNGPIRLWRNGTTSSGYSFGRVQIMISNDWGNICRDTGFNANASDVICHQLGYTGASSFSQASLDNYGVDTSPTVLEGVSCSSADFLVILQCSYRTNPTCTSNSQDVSVQCYSTRIWDNPYQGQVRLSGGATVNEGLVEVYCNGRWGTVCNRLFGQTDADTACRQLGYSTALAYNRLSIEGTTFQPIWLNEVPCIGTLPCLTSCQFCPSTEVRKCLHFQDVTVECYSQSQYTDTRNGTCINGGLGDAGPIVAGVLGGIFLLIFVAVAIVFAVFVCKFFLR